MQAEPLDTEKSKEQTLSQPDNEVDDTIEVIGTDGETITSIPQNEIKQKIPFHSRKNMQKNGITFGLQMMRWELEVQKRSSVEI